MKHLGHLAGACRARIAGREEMARYYIEVWENPDGHREGRGRLAAPVDILHAIGVSPDGYEFDLIGVGTARIRLARPAGYGGTADIVVQGTFPHLSAEPQEQPELAP
jgi:hypothetical protein